MKNNFYSRITSIECVATCVGITHAQWEEFMKGAKRANKKKIDALVKKHLPDLYHKLALNFRNPYNYFKNERFLILVHSGIEYFLEFE